MASFPSFTLRQSAQALWLLTLLGAWCPYLQAPIVPSQYQESSYAFASSSETKRLGTAALRWGFKRWLSGTPKSWGRSWGVIGGCLDGVGLLASIHGKELTRWKDSGIGV